MKKLDSSYSSFEKKHQKESNYQDSLLKSEKDIESITALFKLLIEADQSQIINKSITKYD